MKKLIILTLAVSLLLIPVLVCAELQQASSQSPPVAQPLIREGEFAIKLVEALKLGPAAGEAEAENILSTMGIAPLQGWIANYPVTPQMISQLQNAITTAVDANKLSMGKDEALIALQNVTSELGLAVVADTTDQYAGTEPPTSYGESYNPEVVDRYYYGQGPPVVTYYPPPWDYSYLYSWVPSPFFCSGFFFSGFFILHDFNRIVIRANKVVIVTNHLVNPVTKAVVVVDPARNVRLRGGTRGISNRSGGLADTARRADERITRSNTDRSNTRGFASSEAQRSAASIVERSRERTERDRSGRSMTLEQGTVNRSTPPLPSGRGEAESGAMNSRGRVLNTPSADNSLPFTADKGRLDRRGLSSGSSRDSENRVFFNRGNSASSSNRQGLSSQRAATPEPRVRREQNVIPQQSFNSMGNAGRSFESRGRSFSLPNTFSRDNRQTFSTPKFNASGRGGESSFNAPSRGGQGTPRATQSGGGNQGMQRQRSSRGR